MKRSRKNGISLKPDQIGISDQTKSDVWSGGLKAALDDVKAGRTRFFKSSEEFIAHLEAESKQARRGGRGQQ